MIMENLDSDISKELLIVLSYCDKELVNKIPNSFIQKLSSLAAESSKTFYIDESKSLNEQNISDECKDLLSLIYFMYVEEDKDSILDMWVNNDIKENKDE